MLILTTCKKEPETPEGSNKIELGQTTVTDISYRDATVTTTISSLGGNTISQHGHCWSTSPDPDINADHTSLGSLNNPGTFTSEIKNLQPGIKYYIKSYITYHGGAIYGDQKELLTFALGKPVIKTDSITDIKYNEVTLYGYVSDNGGSEVTQRGFCWNKTGNPTLENNLGITNEGTGEGNFSSTITNLEENTKYYIVAYATNEVGTSYGETKNFTTFELTLPTVTTSAITDLSATTAQGGGNVTNDGNGTITARGVSWNTTGNPTLENCIDYTTDGSGTGSFTSNITGLVELTTYYVVAYATNEEGTAYGQEKSFVAQAPCGQLVVNYGGKEYHTVLIGDQCWFKENLNIGTKINGSQNQTNNQTVEKYCYDDNEANCDEYGGLYQWDEMMQYVTTQGTQGICPDGWHIPTDDEWTTLVDFLGGSIVAGGKMKEAGTTHWNSPNTGATNSSGFTALPGGYRNSGGTFSYLGSYAYFWSSTEYDTPIAWTRLLSYDVGGVSRGFNHKVYGFSVRCLQD